MYFCILSEPLEPSFVEEGKRIVVYIPKYNDGKGKETEKIELAMKQLLRLIQENGLFEVSVCLETIGGWRFIKLVKNVLSCLKDHMSTYLKVPSTVYLIPVEKYKEAQNVFSNAFPDSELEWDEQHYRGDGNFSSF